MPGRDKEEKMNRYRGIDRIGAILIRNKKLLLVTGSDTGYFWLPGGKRNENETHFQALTREVDEELGIKIKLKEEGPYIEYTDAREHVFYPIKNYCYLSDFKGTIKVKNEITEMGWFSKEDIDNGACRALRRIKDSLIPKLIEDGLL